MIKKWEVIFMHLYFPLPGKMGKGILCATIHGNMYVGPSATDVDDKEGVKYNTGNYR